MLEKFFPQQDLFDQSKKNKEFRFSHAELIILRMTLLVVLFFSVFDIFHDIATKSSTAHLTVDFFLSGAIIIGLWILIGRAQRLNKNIEQLQDAYFTAKQDVQNLSESKEQMLKGFGEVIDIQLDAWKLSQAEKEIALLMLKGLSHVEIAEIRHTSERTVRQQSLSVYAKSGVKGRTDLAAFFLEDILNATHSKSHSESSNKLL